MGLIDEYINDCYFQRCEYRIPASFQKIKFNQSIENTHYNTYQHKHYAKQQLIIKKYTQTIDIT